MTIPGTLDNHIGGKEVAARGGGRIEKFDPATGELQSTIARSGAADVDDAVKAAKAAQPGWAATPAVQRGQVLHTIANLMEARADELGAVVAAETGKSRKEGKGEVGAAVQCARFFAGEGQRLFGRTIPSGTPGKLNLTVRTPAGVAGLIIAANTPIANVAWKLFPALICGNGVVLKAAEDTPFTASWTARVALEAGLPAGLFNVVHGLGAEAGEPLVVHDEVDVVSFTGSTRVGRRLAELAGPRLKKISLELGGKNPFVVMDDADLDKAVRWAALSAFSNAGQRCAAGSRIILHDAIFDAFKAKFVAATEALKLGNADTDDLGPVINARQLGNMLAAIERAKEKGAVVLAGGSRMDRPGYFMMPTIIENFGPDDEITETELFGPITCLYRATSFDHAVELANGTPFGLTACIHTRSFDRGLLFCERVRAGVTVINAGTHGSEAHMPFGGRGLSGNGSREPGTEALDVYSELKNIALNVDPAQT
ncbi:MAG TPA: aldehyde dehydrogenase family protein [Geminicoccus sp.]|jgi:aldehyde dehydrogenase (NAD+)|uniref:aldehyde dehydrogenase family protein n=1 Tax=Geminicoccus sp. TaxID=2024832 RepID=UPI002E311F9B|nr:aldehyde dehydrogenase family protein [Geminicoccus sp.]HEX2528330.1 aldehyde dehydrogenase family protein [Geminicoccus sp.]